MGILSWLNPLKAILDPLERIGTKIADAKIAMMRVEGDKEKIAAEERVKSLEAQRDIMVGEAAAGIRTNAWMRAAIAAPVAFLLWKVLVWDKALGEWTGGRTDALDPNLWKVVMIVIGFYFAFAAVEKFLAKK